jgi:O-6-methylguanine DNA methyltransferase
VGTGPGSEGHDERAEVRPGSHRPVLSPPLPGTDRVPAEWALVPGPVEGAYVAWTSSGIVSVVPAVTLEGDGDTDGAFDATFRRHFGRPAVRAATAPDRVREAFRTGDATGLEFDLTGRSEFERDVLHATLDIPPGQVRTYGWVAGRIGRPRAVRAVGTALGHNPVPLLVPCHRVVRSDGTLGRYGFGSEMKHRLLVAEGVDVTTDGDRVVSGTGGRAGP